MLATGSGEWRSLFVIPNALFYGCAVHAAGFFMPRGMKLFGWLIIGVTGVALLAVAWVVPTPSARLDHAFMGALFGAAAPGVWRLPVRDRAARETRVNPEPFLQLDRVIHEKGRLAIMSMLAAAPELSFTELRNALEMTDGNLTTHLRTLQETGYVSVAKSYQRNRRLTTLSLTAAGRRAFADYVTLLERIVRQTRPK